MPHVTCSFCLVPFDAADPRARFPANTDELVCPTCASIVQPDMPGACA